MTLYWITGCLIPDLHINQLTHLVSVNEQLDEIFMKIETSYQSFDLTSGNPVRFHGSRRMLWKLTSDQRPSAGGKKGPPVGAVGAWDFDAPQGRQNINQKPWTRHLSTFPDFPPTNPIVTVPSLMRCGAGFGPTPNRTQPNPLIKIVHIGTSGMCNIQRSSSFISTATQTEDWEIMWNSDFIRLNCTVFRHTHTHTSRDLFTHRRRDCTHAEWQSLEG